MLNNENSSNIKPNTLLGGMIFSRLSWTQQGMSRDLVFQFGCSEGYVLGDSRIQIYKSRLVIHKWKAEKQKNSIFFSSFLYSFFKKRGP